jgi:hypothetical protein
MMEKGCPAAGEQNWPTDRPSPPSGIRPMTKEAGCPGEEEGSPHQRKAGRPESRHRPPVGAVMLRPEDKRKNLK